jgi:WD40 repeat protein
MWTLTPLVRIGHDSRTISERQEDDVVHSVAVSADGCQGVSAGSDATVRVWDLIRGCCIQTLFGHAEEVLAVALHADGRRVVSGGIDQTLRLWDIPSGQLLASHRVPAPIVALAIAASQVVTGLANGDVIFFQIDA